MCVTSQGSAARWVGEGGWREGQSQDRGTLGTAVLAASGFLRVVTSTSSSLTGLSTRTRHRPPWLASPGCEYSSTCLALFFPERLCDLRRDKSPIWV